MGELTHARLFDENEQKHMREEQLPWYYCHYHV